MFRQMIVKIYVFIEIALFANTGAAPLMEKPVVNMIMSRSIVTISNNDITEIRL